MILAPIKILNNLFLSILFTKFSFTFISFLTIFLDNTYSTSLDEIKKKKMDSYRLIVNNSISRFKRLKICIKKKIPMNSKKKMFLIIKG